MKHKKCKRVAIGQSLLTQFARMMVPSTGLAIVSGKRAIDQESIWPMTDCLVTPVDSSTVVALFCQMSLKTSDALGPQESQVALMNALAHHDDPRLREAVAQDAELSAEAVARLSHDPAYAVRLALLSNVEAIKQLDDQTLKAVIGDDVALLINALTSIETWTCLSLLDPSMNEDETVHLKAKAEAYVEAGLKHPDFEVRERAYRMKGTIQDAIEKPVETKARYDRYVRQYDTVPLDLTGLPGDDIYGLAMLDGEVDAKTPMMILPLTIHAEVARLLPQVASSVTMVERLASHPSIEVRKAVAQREGLSSQALETLKADRRYAIRDALLNNDDVLEQLTPDEVIEMIGDDSILFASVFGYGCTNSRLRRRFEARYGESKDPYFLETLANMKD